MAEAAGAAPELQQPAAAGVAATTTTGDAVSARLQQVLALLFPSNLAAKAALFALVVALLPTSQAPRIWELPHLLLLGIIISYGVFGQKNADAEVAAAAAADAKPVDDEASVEAYVSQMMQGSPLVFEDNDRDRDGDDGGGASKVGVQAWSSQYLPDDPLVVVADTNNGDGNASEKPLVLPVRKLKPAAEDSAALTDDISDAIEEEEEEEFLAPKAGYDSVRERAIPSPSSVLDADLTLSPSSPPLLPPPPPPPPPPFLGRGRLSLRKPKARSFNEFGAIGNRSTNERLGLRGVDGKQFRSKSAVQATRSAFAGYDPVVPIGGDDDDAVDDAELDEAVAASESSFSSDVVTDGDEHREEEDMFEEDEEVAEEEDGSSCDEELFELATKPGPEEEEEVEDEVDRKANEFIATFREQIRMQRVEPATRR
ncbi:uncharacterized protein C2845_PM15G16550 [Panicum miliaceum]|uniref:Uncharacterized protein n=1 Tax=Panicum miliaceum TaxID=4540 RepID=A0A3L6Q436_PANMI|nr:uncharacterized protein C2845_PM15G16550 [Panicum miliaceum]